MLRQLLFILDEGCNLLDKYVDFAGKENLEEACLHVLLILERGLELQPKMLEVARATGTRRMLNPLDKLLLGLNPRSGDILNYACYSANELFFYFLLDSYV